MLRKLFIVVFFLTVAPTYSWPTCGKRRVIPGGCGVSTEFVQKLTEKLNILNKPCIEYSNPQEAQLLRYFDDLWSIDVQNAIGGVFASVIGVKKSKNPLSRKTYSVIPFASYAYSMGFFVGSRGSYIVSAQQCYEFLLRARIEGSEVLLSFVAGILDGCAYGGTVAISGILNLLFVDLSIQEGFMRAFFARRDAFGCRDVRDVERANPIVRGIRTDGSLDLDFKNMAFRAALRCSDEDVSLQARSAAIKLDLAQATGRFGGAVPYTSDARAFLARPTPSDVYLGVGIGTLAAPSVPAAAPSSLYPSLPPVDNSYSRGVHSVTFLSVPQPAAPLPVSDMDVSGYAAESEDSGDHSSAGSRSPVSSATVPSNGLSVSEPLPPPVPVQAPRVVVASKLHMPEFNIGRRFAEWRRARYLRRRRQSWDKEIRDYYRPIFKILGIPSREL